MGLPSRLKPICSDKAALRSSCRLTTDLRGTGWNRHRGVPVKPSFRQINYVGFRLARSCRRRSNLPADAVRRGPQRIVGQVRIALRRGLIAVAQERAYHEQTVTRPGGHVGEAVAKTVQTNVLQARTLLDTLPHLRQAHEGPPFLFARQDIGVAFQARQ